MAILKVIPGDIQGLKRYLMLVSNIRMKSMTKGFLYFLLFVARESQIKTSVTNNLIDMLKSKYFIIKRKRSAVSNIYLFWASDILVGLFGLDGGPGDLFHYD